MLGNHSGPAPRQPDDESGKLSSPLFSAVSARPLRAPGGDEVLEYVQTFNTEARRLARFDAGVSSGFAIRPRIPAVDESVPQNHAHRSRLYHVDESSETRFSS